MSNKPLSVYKVLQVLKGLNGVGRNLWSNKFPKAQIKGVPSEIRLRTMYKESRQCQEVLEQELLDKTRDDAS